VLDFDTLEYSINLLSSLFIILLSANALRQGRAGERANLCSRAQRPLSHRAASTAGD